jgi:hypothetical protein
LDIMALVAKSDLIIVGTARVQGPNAQLGEPSRAGADVDVTVVAEIGGVLKGDPGNVAAVPLRFTLPDGPSGYGRIHANAHRVFFIGRRGDQFVPADRYYPSLPAATGEPAQGDSAFERVVTVIALALRDQSASPETRIEAAHALWGQTLGVAVSSLREVAKDSDRSVSLTAVAALLGVGSVDVLPLAEQALLTDQGVSSEVLHNIRVGLASGSFGEASLPYLSNLLTAADVATRRSVARSVRAMRLPAAIDTLAKALDDQDIDVRYAAVMGLAELAGANNEWAPSMPVFAADPVRYTSHWREWTKKR